MEDAAEMGSSVALPGSAEFSQTDNADNHEENSQYEMNSAEVESDDGDPALHDMPDEHAEVAVNAGLPVKSRSRSIVIFGEDTRSTRFMARSILHISCDNRENCEVHTDAYGEKYCVECGFCEQQKVKEFGVFQVCTMECQHSDTCIYLMKGTFESTPQSQLLTDLKQCLEYQIDSSVEPDTVLLLFTLPLGHFDKSGRFMITSIVELLDSQASKMSALVVTGCENLTKEAKDECKQELQHNCETTDLAKFMKKGIHTIGFPDMENVRKEVADIYKEEIRRSLEILEELISYDVDANSHSLGVDTLVQSKGQRWSDLIIDFLCQIF